MVGPAQVERSVRDKLLLLGPWGTGGGPMPGGCLASPVSWAPGVNGTLGDALREPCEALGLQGVSVSWTHEAQAVRPELPPVLTPGSSSARPVRDPCGQPRARGCRGRAPVASEVS